MSGTYNPWLVVLSIVVAVIASFVSLDLASRVTAMSGKKSARYWLGGGAIAMGIGIWSMHFIGMLAFSLPIALAYDASLTLYSLLTAIMASAVALHTASRERMSLRRLVVAGTVMGLGVAAMHYLGLAATRMQPAIRFDLLRVGVSIAIAVAASIGALAMAFHLRAHTVVFAFWKKAAGAVAMGCAIAGMHYTGMSAAGFAANSICTVSNLQAFDNDWLALVLGIFTVPFLVMVLAVATLESHQSTIRHRLALLVIACMLPAVLLTVVAVTYQYQRERTRTIEDAITAAKAISVAVDRDLASVEAALYTLASSPLWANRDLAGLHAYASRSLQHINAANIYLIDADGQQLFNTFKPIATPLPHTGNMPLIRRVFESKTSAVSELFTGAVVKKPILAVAVPVAVDGTVTYALGATIFPERVFQTAHAAETADRPHCHHPRQLGQHCRKDA